MLTRTRIVMVDHSVVERPALVRGVWALHRDVVYRRRYTAATWRRLTYVLEGYTAGRGWSVTHRPTSGTVLHGIALGAAHGWFERLAREVPFLGRDAKVHQQDLDWPEELRAELWAAQVGAAD